MSEYMGEFVGTAILILLGKGTVANVVLRGTKSQGAGWIVITWGSGMAVFVAVFVVGRFSGAHINPAVTLGLAISDQFSWSMVPGYIAAQMAGAALGAVLVWIHFFPHWKVTDDVDAKLACFCTGPATRQPRELRRRHDRHRRARIRGAVHRGSGAGARRARRAAGRVARTGDRSRAGRHDRVRHQSGP
jgi:glycerol uptake facilitator-like aquaporin